MLFQMRLCRDTVMMLYGILTVRVFSPSVQLSIRSEGSLHDR